MPAPSADFWRALLHRWFVEYNPFYLVSAMLVLAGLNLVSGGLSHDGSVVGPLAVALLAEIYAGSLLAGAALLTRNGQKRSAVILAVLAVAYQGDLTLHTETCALLGVAGVVATLVWLALFALKLVALGWALRLRIAPRAFATAILGAGGVAAAPYVWTHLQVGERGALLALFLGALCTMFPRGGGVTLGETREDAWSAVVLRRSVRVAWSLWSLLLLVHVVFWTNQGRFAALPVLASVTFVVAARTLREGRLWSVLVASVGLVALLAPAQLAFVALLAALALVVRVFDGKRACVLVAPAEDPSPYRATTAHAAPAHVQASVQGTPEERLRLLTGALVFGYVAAFAYGWVGGALPPHRLVVDVLFLALALALVWRLRARLVLSFVAASAGHAVAAAGVVPSPHGSLEWGAAALGLGFFLLFGSLAVSHRARHRPPPRAPSGAPMPQAT